MITFTLLPRLTRLRRNYFEDGQHDCRTSQLSSCRRHDAKSCNLMITAQAYCMSYDCRIDRSEACTCSAQCESSEVAQCVAAPLSASFAY